MMDSSAASAFVYAKASGLLKKSFTGANANKLFSAKSLKELYTLLFEGDVPAIPENLLAKEIEVKAAENFDQQYNSLLSYFVNPEPILSEIIKFYEYENSGISDPEQDRIHVMNLWTAAEKLPGDDRKNLEKLFKTEISFKNILWALRLKVYYQMTEDEIKEHLVYSQKFHSKSDILAKEAMEILGKDIGSYDDWKSWKYAQFLNPHEEGVIWEIDPCWIERAVKNYLNKFYQHSFHKDPMSVTSFVSWFKIKQYELDCIRTAAEGLRLDVDSEKVKEAAGFSEASSK
ncbi:MAG: V-type ATPase subunit [Treponema sp.]|nr:V-type ATPase subunit [Candidatus Treponema equifaecale]